MKRWGWRVMDANQVALITSVKGGQICRGCQRRYEQVRNEARDFGGYDRRLFTGAKLEGSARFWCRRRVLVLLLLLSCVVATTTLVPHRRRLVRVLFRRRALIATRSAKHAAPAARQEKHKAAKKGQVSSEQAHLRNASPVEPKRQTEPLLVPSDSIVALARGR